MTKANGNPKPTDKTNVLQVESDEAGQPKAIAQAALRPSVQAALTVQQVAKTFGDLDLMALISELQEQAATVKGGSLARQEAMLVTQAHTLDMLFNELARRSARNMGEYVDAAERYMRLALKAQSQCRTTIETLAEIKNPRPVAFVHQANISNGPQQVNNGSQPPSELAHQYAQAHARAREIENQPNKLLEGDHGQRLDTGATRETIGRDSQLETVDAINRATNANG